MIYAAPLTDFYTAPTALDVVIQAGRITLRTFAVHALAEAEAVQETENILGTPSPLPAPGNRPLDGVTLSYERLGWDYAPPIELPEGAMLSALSLVGVEEATRLGVVFPLKAGDTVAVNVDHSCGAIGGFIVNRSVLGSVPSFLFVAGPNGAASWEDGDIVIGHTVFGFRCNLPTMPIEEDHPLHAAMLATVKPAT